MVKRDRLPADIRTRLPRIAEHFRCDQRVVAIYLFGSFAHGNEDALSDIDLGVLMDPTLPGAERRRLEIDLIGDVTHLLGTEEISFVFLNEAPLTFRYEVIRTGQVLIDNDSRTRLDFEVRSEDLYMDFKPALDAYDDALLQQLTATHS